GAWRAYEDLPARWQRGIVEVQVSPDAADAVLLLGERRQLGAAAEAIRQLVAPTFQPPEAASSLGP
ncbi:MAG: hypothetical protein QHJ73_15680, partial [Armatimonadota bacterium]|nr:hypothetical protein [Armatimonadota bacterium]